MNDPTTSTYPAALPEAAAASVGGLERYLPCFPDELCHHVDDECQVGDNTTRASFAAHAVIAHARRTGQLKIRSSTGEVVADEGIKTVLGDLIGNLQHLCDGAGVSWEAILDSAATHHRTELTGGG